MITSVSAEDKKITQIFLCVMKTVLVSKTPLQRSQGPPGICELYSENCSYRQLKQNHQGAIHPWGQCKKTKTTSEPLAKVVVVLTQNCSVLGWSR